MSVLLIRNGTVITLGPANRIIKNGAVLIRDDVIEAVGTSAKMGKRPKGAKIIDARGGLIMPGFINTHMHLYSTFARGLSPKQPPPANFPEILERMWWPLDKALNEKDMAYSALIPLIECIKNGTTTIIDHHESQGLQLGCMDVFAKALRKTGVRGCLSYGVSDRYGKGDEGIEENIRFITKIRKRQQRGNDMVAAMFGLHALFTVNQRTLKKSIAAADELGVGVHVHVAEDKSDQSISQRKYKKSVVQRLFDVGGLGHKTIAVHCVHISPEEMDLLSQTDTCVVHNPQSNMNNAVGAASVLKMMDKGILVGLGTDGMTSNMRDEVRVANIMHKHGKKDPRVFFVEAGQLLLQNNAAIANRFFRRPLGVLEKGAYGDVIVMDYDPPTPLSNETFLGHFLFGICGATVNSTIVNGKVLMENRRLIGLNEAKIMAESRKQAKDFWRRF